MFLFWLWEAIFLKKAIVFILTVIIILLSVNAVFGGTQKSYTPKVCYEIVKINYGDTIWSIAQQYDNEFTEIRSYVDEIKEYNSLKNDKIIAGKSLIVPVYY